MSTLAEIQDAITKLPSEERKALSLWLNSQTESRITVADEAALVRSLEEAMRDIDDGKGVPIEEVSKRVRSWAAT